LFIIGLTLFKILKTELEDGKNPTVDVTGLAVC
jgi:hypothetical protein